MTERQQLEIDFEPGLTEQYPEFHDVVRASVYGCGKQHQLIAASLDMSPSLLSRKLANNPNDETDLGIKRLTHLIDATGDIRPVHWLVEKYCENPESRRKRALEQLPGLIDRLQSILSEARAETKS